MDKLNNFILKEGVNKLELLSKDEILLKAGCESVVYLDVDDIDMYKQQKYEFKIGAFFHSPFWLNLNQSNFIRVQLQYYDKLNNNIVIVLDQVGFYFFLLKKYFRIYKI